MPPQTQRFYAACAAGDVERARTLLQEAGSNMHVHHEYGKRNTPFVDACKAGRIGVVHMFLELTAQHPVPRQHMHAGMREAARLDHLQTLHVLVQSVKSGRALCLQTTQFDVMFDALRRRRYDVVGYCAGTWKVMLESVMRTGVKDWDDLQQYNSGTQPLDSCVLMGALHTQSSWGMGVAGFLQALFQHACKVGHAGVVHRILAMPRTNVADAVNVNAANDAAFRAACAGGHTHVVRMLLALRGERRVHVNVDNDVAFRAACAGGHSDTARILLALTGDRRVNVHACGGDALARAYDGNHENVISILTKCKGDRMWSRAINPQATAPPLDESVEH